MSEAGYQVTHIDEIPEPAAEKDAGDPDWHAVRIHFGIQSFGVNAYTAIQEGQLVWEHEEIEHSGTKHEELYFVSKGNATFTVERRDRGSACGHLRLRARPGVAPVGSGTRGGDDHPLPRRHPRRGLRRLSLGAKAQPGVITRSANLRDLALALNVPRDATGQMRKKLAVEVKAHSQSD